MRSSARPRFASQTGYALLIILVLLVTGTLGFILTKLNSADVRVERAKVNERALAQAKQALIGFAITASQGPGHLPCPDEDNDGDSEGNSCSSTVGRLPWKTLELQDLRDDSGEALWYAVSDNFINKTNNPVNSETKGQLSVTGLAANEVIAVIFAPGAPLTGQTRNAANVNNVANYLEGENADGTPNQFEVKTLTGLFNDQLVLIRASDLFPVVENAVATKIKAELRPILEAYRLVWGSYPLAAPYDGRDPSIAPTSGGIEDLFGGFIPIDLPETGLAWTNCDATLPVNTQSGSQVISFDALGNPSGEIIDASGVVDSSTTPNGCKVTVNYSGGPEKIAITMATSIPMGRGYFGRYCPSLSPKVRLELGSDNFLGGSNDPGASSACVDATTPWSNTTERLFSISGGDFVIAAGKSDAAGNTKITYSVDTKAHTSPLIFTVRPPSASRALSKTYIGAANIQRRFPEIQTADWFFYNNWHRLTFYQKASGALTCGGTPCVQVESPTGTVVEQAEAILVLGSGALLGVTDANRSSAPILCATPPSNVPKSSYLAYFFEGKNVQGCDLVTGIDIFTRGARTATFNDLVIPSTVLP